MPFILNKKHLLSAMFCIFALTMQAERKEINDNWKFLLADIPEAKYLNYDDTHWQTLHLPHDWAFEKGYSADGAQKEQGGYASGGIGWYRKDIFLSSKDLTDKQLFIDFDASYMNTEVWINETYLGKHTYGYSPFSFDLTPYLHEGRNCISVRVDNSLEPSARWYHGCGIYGNVYLRTQGNIGFDQQGTFVHTCNTKGELGIQSIVRHCAPKGKLTAVYEIYDQHHKRQTFQKVTFQPNTEPTDTIRVNLKVNQPEIWSPEHPHLYTLRSRLTDSQGTPLDSQTVQVGFRDLNWSPEQGFYLNGKPYKLRGVCEHLEGGPTGALYTPQLLRWKLKLLKDMGCNAIRTAHNAQLPFFYDLCDELGLLVMDEFFDGWKQKATYDYGQQAFESSWEKDLRTLIRRDRNHPCIFIYSVGNETRGDVAARLVKVCHEEDSTRLVTSGSSSSSSMDVIGMNGGSETDDFIASYTPQNKPFIATENPHTWQVRDYYRSQTWYRDGFSQRRNGPQKIENLTAHEIFTYDWTTPERKKNRKQIFNSSYDNATVRTTARRIIEVLRDKAWFSGSFRWTGFDYLGEAGYVHGGWPFRAFQSGALDLAGFPKDLYYLYQSEWSEKDMVHILPHWTHPYMPHGTEIPVWVYTSGDEVELTLNGKSFGRKRKGEKWNQMQCEFKVPWTEGTLEAIAYRKGVEIARTTQTTAQAPEKWGITIENPHLKADAQDISILTIRQEDSKGIRYPYGENRVHVHLEGPAKVLSFENGNPVDTECNYNATSRRCFFGLNRIFIQSTGTNPDEPVRCLLAGIQGDKKLKISNQITITCNEIQLRGKSPRKKWKIYYTTDGTEPHKQSKLYQAPFRIGPHTTVKAVIYEGKKEIMRMSETFGPDEGLYWGNAAENNLKDLGDQAESATLSQCKIIQDAGTDAFGKAYVIPENNKSSISWYFENDGDPQEVIMSLRYLLPPTKPDTDMDLYQNGHFVQQVHFSKSEKDEGIWREIQIPITLHSGGNTLTLRNLSVQNALGIDQIRIQHP